MKTPRGTGARPALLLLALLLFATPGGADAQQVWQTRAEAPAWLGIGYEIRWVQRDSGCEPRVWVEHVVQGSPADRAGLRVGDAIIALDDQPLPGARLEAVAGRLHPGDSLRFRVARDGQVRRLTAVADRRPARPPAAVVAPFESGFRTTSSGPLVELEGGTLVVRNVEGGSRSVRGYWLATSDGRTEYRRLGSWSRDDLDERVVRLLRCAEEMGTRAALGPRVDLQQLQRRADSLRIIITRRAMEPSLAPGQAPSPPDLRGLDRRRPDHPRPAPPLPGLAPDVHTSPSTYILRMENHLATELRGVAGAELAVLEPELASYFRNVREGLLVLRVASGSDAERAGLRPGDVIVEGDGRGLDSPSELRALLARPNPQAVQLRVVRKGRSQLFSLPRSGR